MSQLFYDHLLNIDHFHAHIELLDISDEDKVEIITAFDSAVHHQVMIIILDHLHPSEKSEFLRNFHARPHDVKHLHLLRSKSLHIETKIKDAVDTLIYDLLQHLHSSS